MENRKVITGAQLKTMQKARALFSANDPAYWLISMAIAYAIVSDDESLAQCAQYISDCCPLLDTAAGVHYN